MKMASDSDSDSDGDSVRAAAERLRQEFDRAFAQPLGAVEEAWDTLLAIRVREDPFALRLSEIAGLFVDRPVTPIPTPFPDLLGVTGFRGTVIPVFDLGALLGYPAAAAPRWLTLSAGASPVALAFDGFEGTQRIVDAPEQDIPRSGSDGAGRHVRGVAHAGGGRPRPVVDIPSILDAIDHRSAHRGPNGGAASER
jgi:purine-binding chemotaxis protein CheW